METLVKNHHKGSGYSRGSHERKDKYEKLVYAQKQNLKGTVEHKKEEISNVLLNTKEIGENTIVHELQDNMDISKKHNLLSASDLKEKLLLPDEKIDNLEVHNIQETPEENNEYEVQHKASFQEKINIPKRIKDWKENIEESFKESLQDMLEAKIITEEQKKEVEESLKSPEVMESIRTWISVFGFSTLYIGVNTVTITPLSGLLGGPGMGAIAYLIMYLLKRILVSSIVSTVGKNLERKNYISNMSIIPILGEQITLIELYKKFPLAAQLFYASMRTKSLRKEYKEHDVSTEKSSHQKEMLRKKRDEKVRKNAGWIKKKSDGLVKFETSIGKFFINIKDNVIHLFTE